MSRAVDVLVTKQARAELDEAIQKMDALDKSIVKALKSVKQLSGAKTKNPIPSGTAASIQNTSKFMSNLNAQYKESERLAAAVAKKKAELAQAETRNAKSLARLREETRLLNRATKEEAILSSKMVGEYKKLETRRNQAARALKNEIAAQNSSTRSIRKKQREFDKLNRKYQQANRAAKDYRDNVGNYGSAIGKATSAFRRFGAVLGIYSGFQIGKEIYEQVKQLDGLNLALKQVTETADNFSESQQFLTDVAEEAGADIFSLTSAYTKFLASAKVTNLTMDETRNIFRQTAKAAGVLGLSQEATNGAFRALEQILSKGKVQAEEIRGQLGERLPGAFQILAQSMGLTTAELSKQLELGNVISDEVLPAFAEELAKVYNLETVQRVETLAAAQARLGNEWKLFLQNVEGGSGAISNVFKDFLEVLSNNIRFLREMNMSVEETREEFNRGLRTDAMAKAIDDLKIKAIDMGVSLKGAARISRSEFTFAVTEAAAKVTELEGKVKYANEQIDKGGERGKAWEAELVKLNKQLDSASAQLAIKEGKLDAVNKITRVATRTQREYNDETKKGITLVQGSIGFLEALIRRKEQERNAYATTSREYKIATEAIKGLRGELLKLKADLIGDKVEIVPNVDPEALDGVEQGFYDLYNALAKIEDERAKKADEINKGLLEYQEDKSKAAAFWAKWEMEQLENITKDIFSTFEQYYGMDMELFRKLMEGKKLELEDFANTSKSIIDVVAQSRNIAYENDIAEKRRSLQAIQNDEDTSEKQKKAAREKFQQEERQIRIKQAKTERNAVLFQIAIDTALGVQKAVAASPLTFGLPFSAFVAASGLAQAAFVAAQPLPQFAMGTDDAPEGPALVDEEGAELQLDKTGALKDIGSDKGPRVKYLEKGDKIIPADKTKEILKNVVSNDNQILQEKIDLWIARQANPSISTVGIERTLEKGLSKYSNRPINVKVTVDNPITGY